MASIYIDVNEHISRIFVGYRGENNANQIHFDISDWIAEYGAGTAAVYIFRPGENVPYPASCTINSSQEAVWTVSDVDTALEGKGSVQLVYSVDTVVKKTATFIMVVGKSVDASPTEIPDAYRSLIGEIQEMVDEVETYILMMHPITTATISGILNDSIT